MKNYFILLAFIFIGTTQFTIAQNITQSKNDLKVILCQRWDIDFVLLGEMKIEQLPGVADFDIIFNEDGSYKLLDGEKNNVGKWTFYPDKKYIQLEMNSTKTLRIESLTLEKLITISSPGTDGPPMDIEIHFKPYSL